MSSMGMTKSTSQNIPSGGAWVKLTGFTVRAGYPGTILTNDTLVMDGSGVGDLRWQGSAAAIDASYQSVRVVKNGTTVVAGPTGVNVIGTATGITVEAGDTLELQAANTYFTARPSSGAFLEFNQTTQDHPAGAGPNIGWFTSSTVNLERAAQPESTVVGWNVEAGIGKQAEITASRSVGWSTQAELYVGQKYDVAANPTIGWQVSAGIEVLRKAQPPEVLWEDTAVSLHTADGRVLGALLCTGMEGITWGRERREVSSCEITALTQADPDLLEDLRPWVHWVTVWNGERAVWSGPIQSVSLGRSVTRIMAKDTGTFMWRTRVPITYRWADTDPTDIAATVLGYMNDLHGITAAPIVLPAVTESFTYNATADTRMLHQMFDDLTKLGLEWTVVAGRFILGKFPSEPVASLAECDFLVQIERLRDGTATFNDIRVQGQNWAQTAVAPLAGLRLQTLVSLDDVFGVSNIQKAARLYAEETSAIRDVLVLPSNASLHPEAQVDLDDLIPGKTLLVQAEGVSSLMVVDQMSVTATPSSFDTQVTLVAVSNRGEVAELVGG